MAEHSRDLKRILIHLAQMKCNVGHVLRQPIAKPPQHRPLAVGMQRADDRHPRPRRPTAGFVPCSPKKVPDPFVWKLHDEYLPIRPAPAAKIAALTFSTASAGTKTTNLCCMLLGSISFNGWRWPSPTASASMSLV